MRGLQGRILASALVGALLTALLSQLGLIAGLRGVLDQGLADLEAAIPAEELTACAAAPEFWVRGRGPVRVTAHWPDGVSDWSGAPALSAEDIPALGEPPRQLGTDGRFWERRTVQRVAVDGPCAVLYAELPYAAGDVQQLRIYSFIGVFLGSLLVLAGVFLFALRPTLRRLRELDAAAAGLGGPSFAPAGDAIDDELGRISRTLDASHARLIADQAELKAQSTLLERHLAGVAHDLRTPIASLQLTLESLSERAPGPLRGDLSAAGLELGALEGLADNLLQASRIRAGLGDHGAELLVDLGEVCARLRTRFGILGRARSVRIRAALPDGPVWARCDPSLAERALANLVHNALMHGPAGASIGIVLDRSSDRFQLAVQSAGEPIPPERLAALSQRRLTAPDRSRSRAGDGLGLGITNEVAERSGWAVRYSSSEVGGLRVEIEGPLAEPPEGGAPDAAGPIAG